jgi:hypothetical protein
LGVFCYAVKPQAMSLDRPRRGREHFAECESYETLCLVICDHKKQCAREGHYPPIFQHIMIKS